MATNNIIRDEFDRLSFHVELMAKELYRIKPVSLVAFIAFHGISRLQFESFVDAMQGFERYLIGSNSFDAGAFSVIVTDELCIGEDYINDLICALYSEKLFLNVVYEYVQRYPNPMFAHIPKPD